MRMWLFMPIIVVGLLAALVHGACDAPGGCRTWFA